ncbi:MAG TPA: hypothetical protein VGK11_04790 [Actinomycetota bacterium]
MTQEDARAVGALFRGFRRSAGLQAVQAPRTPLDARPPDGPSTPTSEEASRWVRRLQPPPGRK